MQEEKEVELKEDELDRLRRVCPEIWDPSTDRFWNRLEIFDLRPETEKRKSKGKKTSLGR